MNETFPYTATLTEELPALTLGGDTATEIPAGTEVTVLERTEDDMLRVTFEGHYASVTRLVCPSLFSWATR